MRQGFESLVKVRGFNNPGIFATKCGLDRDGSAHKPKGWEYGAFSRHFRPELVVVINKYTKMACFKGNGSPHTISTGLTVVPSSPWTKCLFTKVPWTNTTLDCLCEADLGPIGTFLK